MRRWRRGSASLAGIGGAVDVHGDGGNDSLILYDDNSAGAVNYNVTDTRIDRTAAAPITYATRKPFACGQVRERTPSTSSRPPPAFR
jgi:hypothetical protein